MSRRIVLALLGLAMATPAAAEMIHLHAKRGNLAGVLAELDNGVPVDLRSTNMTSDPAVTPLFVAAKFGQAEVVAALLERGADPAIFFDQQNALYTTGTALHHAARFGYAEVVDLLIEAGADVASYERYIATPLHQALRGGHPEIAARLIAAGAPERVLAPPIDAALAAADTARGEFLARGCDICHSRAAGAGPGPNGPNLWGVFGRPAAAATDFTYSDFLSSSDLVWDAGTLNHYLAAPYLFLPGTSKVMVGIEDPADRASLIAYLETLAD